MNELWQFVKHLACNWSIVWNVVFQCYSCWATNPQGIIDRTIPICNEIQLTITILIKIFRKSNYNVLLRTDSNDWILRV